MKARLSRLRMRDLGLLVVVAGVVAVAAVFGAREAGLGGGEAVAEGEPLTLTLTTQTQICETERARRWGYSGLRTNEQGRRVRESITIGWTSEAVVPVRWQVSGGTAPYTLVIDGESRDVDRDYNRPLGIAKVGCSDTAVGTFFQEEDPAEGVMRFYRADPEVDSGWKTVRATVTDANGATAEATVDVYVILDLGGGTSGEIMKRGETYRMYGRLLTAPADYDIRVGSIAERDCSDVPAGRRCETTSGFILVGANAWVHLYESDLAEDSRGRTSAAGTSGASNVNNAIDDFTGSVGQPPNLHRSER